MLTGYRVLGFDLETTGFNYRSDRIIQFAFIGSDAALDVVPSQIEGVGLPVHLLTIVAMGVDLFDNQDLEALAAKAGELGRWEFLLVAGPLAVETGTGSPINALAIF